MRAIKASDLPNLRSGASIRLAGLVLVRQRPGTASGIVFITLEDESGIANLVVFKDVFDRYRKNILAARLLMVDGTVQKEGDVIHIIARNLQDISLWLAALIGPQEELPFEGAELKRAIPEARNFH